ncbi:L,D-transpeptidase [Methylobacterium sp. E-005]|uniref:L,D-transpeptidase n=1 Tax=Methylobacterium sp. E-005 TaxID=2836549 RepID=UPI001FB9E2F4|nr:L,D-transpeptidase [Methylobacterium sp. E-005]MCJ2088412.1 L,D-transpeptidase [Methylobacterium sp. E-005]
MTLTRRSLLAGTPLLVAGCVTREPPAVADLRPPVDPAYTALYAALDSEPFPVPAVDLSGIDPRFLRREVAYATAEPPGTIVVDPAGRHAYLVRAGGRAIRYGVGVGREEAFNFQGAATIARKAEWPRWTPTPAMIKREPDRYGPYAGGLPGGAGNPLGPRALYLYRDGRDTLYRLHGTTEPHTIGTMVSSGCVRFLNQDIIDLYARVPVGSRAVVLAPIGRERDV